MDRIKQKTESLTKINKKMDGNLVPIILFISMFGSAFGIVYVAITARNKERLALIEKGMDSSIFQTQETHGRYNALKWGLVIVGVGIGLIFGNIFDMNGIMDEEVAYFAMTLVFGGLGLLVYYLLIRKIKPE
jgi:hypothetical protein